MEEESIFEVLKLNSVIKLKQFLTTPRPKERGFFLHHAFTNSRKTPCCPVTYTPEARTSSPLALILRAALISRSCCVPHEGQTQLLTESGSLLMT